MQDEKYISDKNIHVRPVTGKYLCLWMLMQNEKRSRDEIRNIQNRKLRRLIRHAYEHVPYYRDLLREASVEPENIRSAEDLKHIPVSCKADLQARGISAWMDRRVEEHLRLFRHDTSGSSGAPLTFHVDAAYEHFRKAQYLRPYLTNGRKITDRSVTFGMHRSLPAKWFHRLGLMVDHAAHSSAPLETHLQKLESVKPAVLIGHGSAIVLIAAHKLDTGFPRHSPRLVFTDSELLPPSSRQCIARAFGADVIDVYGSIETENIAYECSSHEGYHIAEDCVVMEFLKDGHPVGPGEEGEIVCTVLDNYTMPFIRYNLQDCGSYIEKPCSCGRSFPLMNILFGRQDDYVLLPDGTRRSAWGLCQGFRPLAAVIRQFQILQHQPDAFTIKIVPTPKWDAGAHARISEMVLGECPGARVDLVLVDRIGREPSGKFRVFKYLPPANPPGSEQGILSG